MITITVSIAGFLLLLYSIGRMNTSLQFKKEIKELFSKSSTAPPKIFTDQQLSGLPEPVQHYFKHVLREGQPFINYARLTHNGQFKTGLDKDWVI